MTQPPQYPEASLLGLPAELRNRILSMVVEQWIYKPGGTRRIFNLRYLTTAKNIVFRSFYTNKQMLHELRALFFGNVALSLEATEARPCDMHLYQLPDGTLGTKAIAEKADRASSIHYVDELRAFIEHETRIAYLFKTPIHFSNDQMMTMMVPHPAVRRCIRLLELRLSLPRGGYHNSPLPHALIYGGGLQDWLYPVRVIKSIGFTGLKTLKIVVEYKFTHVHTITKERVYDVATGERTRGVEGPDITAWAKEQIESMDLQGIEWNLEMVKGHMYG